ncbi:hypothetical protein BP6252_04445 [Coleophoma cylindrospora]|uniref:Uncharacterized protein n=1 Tax=Coleophoma cylindrospora TaxID=1849047 RepID=A0A3D8S0H7_9HELO|nr:hypothetical protein BP6252_04445 [Coleophoma cylindrospora]
MPAARAARDDDNAATSKSLSATAAQVRMRLVNDSSEGFVYTSASSSLTRPTVVQQEALFTLPNEIQFLSYLSATERSLLHHFVNEASRITSCHSHVQKVLCQLVLPLAADSPALMYATLAWAGIHSVQQRGMIDNVSNPDAFIAGLKTQSLSRLRTELERPEKERMNALLATVRTLCQCEIHSGSDGTSTWRVHVEGAKAIMAAVKNLQLGDGDRSINIRPEERLLYRWYDSLDSLAALTSSGNPANSENAIADFEYEMQPDEIYLDDYNGYYTDLSMLLGKIGLAIRALREQSTFTGSPASMESVANFFELKLQKMMARDHNALPKFYPGVIEKLTMQGIYEYALCNESYQQLALIHINRRLRSLASRTPVIQASVKKIIECVKAITPATGSSPLIVMATPLFTAGCEAHGEDRDAVKELLLQLYSSLKIRNIKLALQVLEAYWAREVEEENWEDILKKRNWDFIPY